VESLCEPFGRVLLAARLWVRLKRLVGGPALFGVEVSSNTERLAICGTRSKPTNRVCGQRLAALMIHAPDPQPKSSVFRG